MQLAYFLLFFFFPSLWQSSRYRFASRLLPNCPSAVGNFTWKRHGSHFSCNVSLVRSWSRQIVIPFVSACWGRSAFMRYCMGKIHRPPIFLGPLAAGSWSFCAVALDFWRSVTALPWKEGNLGGYLPPFMVASVTISGDHTSLLGTSYRRLHIGFMAVWATPDLWKKQRPHFFPAT